MYLSICLLLMVVVDLFAMPLVCFILHLRMVSFSTCFLLVNEFVHFLQQEVMLALD